MARVVTRMRRSQTHTSSSGMGMRSQGIHVARFATDLQLVLDEGIVRPGRVRRWMVGRSLEWTPTKWAAGWSPTTR